MFNNRFFVWLQTYFGFFPKKMIKQFDNESNVISVEPHWLPSGDKAKNNTYTPNKVNWLLSELHTHSRIYCFLSVSFRKYRYASDTKRPHQMHSALYIAFVRNAFNMLIRIHVCHSLDGSIVISKEASHLRRQTIDEEKKSDFVNLFALSVCWHFSDRFLRLSNQFSLSRTLPFGLKVGRHLFVFSGENILFFECTFRAQMECRFCLCPSIDLFVYSV